MTHLGPVHSGYDPLDLVREGRRELEFRFDGPIPPWEKGAADALISQREALLAQAGGLVSALQADIASIEARIALHRRQLRLDVRQITRRRKRSLDIAYDRLCIDHDKSMLRLLRAKLVQARAMLAAASRHRG